MDVLLFASLLCISTSCVIQANEICLSCRDVVRPRDCDYIQICGPDEACYVDQSVNTLGYIRYKVGCRDKQQCGVPTPVGKRRDLTFCSECCTGQLCNSAGCKSTGFGHRGPICFNCPQQLYEHGCNAISVCGHDEVCKFSVDTLSLSHDTVYKTSCDLRQKCENTINQLNNPLVGRKRNNLIYKDNNNNCALQCCDTDLCNTGCNSTSTSSPVVTIAPTLVTPTQPKQTAFTSKPIQPTPPNYCLNNPCVHGTCSLYLNTYACSCDTGYNGRNCSKVQDNCLLQNPCVRGTCHNDVTTSTGYTCKCISGYQGTNCDQLIDHCASITCQHGSQCQNSAGGATCMCTSGYTGSLCENLIDHHCASITCQHGGQCMNNAVGATCSCRSGYTGILCENVIDHCASITCQHSGQCQNSVAGATCSCVSGYTGSRCENVIDHCASITCQHSGQCQNSAAGSACSCTSGYTGSFCENVIDHCASVTCQHGGQCNNNAGGATCSCPSGTSGNRCQTVDGAWSAWGAWDTCSFTCGSGMETRQRSCNHPAPSQGGQLCNGISSNSRYCNLVSCPVDGHWSAWSPWSKCTVTCGDGVHSRHRSCNNPAPSHGGHSCIGRNPITRNCNLGVCPHVCDAGWVSIGQSCYKMGTTYDSFSVATRHCKQLGAKLVQIDDQRENNLLKSYYGKAVVPNWFWIGIKKAHNTQHDWLYVDSGKPVSYTNWAVSDNSVNDCAVFFGFSDSISWQPEPCTSTFKTLCEK